MNSRYEPSQQSKTQRSGSTFWGRVHQIFLRFYSFLGKLKHHRELQQEKLWLQQGKLWLQQGKLWLQQEKLSSSMFSKRANEALLAVYAPRSSFSSRSHRDRKSKHSKHKSSSRDEESNIPRPTSPAQPCEVANNDECERISDHAADPERTLASPKLAEGPTNTDQADTPIVIEDAPSVQTVPMQWIYLRPSKAPQTPPPAHIVSSRNRLRPQAKWSEAVPKKARPPNKPPTAEQLMRVAPAKALPPTRKNPVSDAAHIGSCTAKSSSSKYPWR